MPTTVLTFMLTTHFVPTLREWFIPLEVSKLAYDSSPFVAHAQPLEVEVSTFHHIWWDLRVIDSVQ